MEDDIQKMLGKSNFKRKTENRKQNESLITISLFEANCKLLRFMKQDINKLLEQYSEI